MNVAAHVPVCEANKWHVHKIKGSILKSIFRIDIHEQNTHQYNTKSIVGMNVAAHEPVWEANKWYVHKIAMCNWGDIILEYIKKQLSFLKSENLYRGDFKNLCCAQGAKVVIDKREIILFGSNNYLGLSDEPTLKNAAIEAIKMYGTGAGGSRLTTGSYILNEKLEEEISKFKGTESSLVYNTGYMANLGIIQALCNKDWVVFCDKYNHASIIDGCILSGAKLLRYKHCDMIDLSNKIKEFKGKYNLIITDGVFSMDGDVAPLSHIVKLAKEHDIITMVDDAHGLGVLGENGAGTASYFGVEKEIDIHMGTLSKSIPSIGGYVSGKKHFIDYFNNFSRSFIFSTALPPSAISVSLKAIEIIKNDTYRRKNLLEISKRLKNNLLSSGFSVSNTVTPIISIIIGDTEKTIEFSESLYEDGIFIPAIRPPTVPKGTSRLRVSLMATHTLEDIDYLLDRLKYRGKRLGML
ncbi:UNVERIFIED_CONTAM: 8-amino-7-oxononanoate synthase [Acetivibrio alkalicellulosi]